MTPLLTVRELAALLAVPERTVHRLALNREIPAFRIRRVYRFDLEEVLAALQTSEPNGETGRRG